MVNFKEEIAKLIAAEVTDLELAEIQSMIEVPQDSKMGDYAFPCFKLAKVMRKAPPLIAKGIAEKIAENTMFEKVEQVNAYVNMFISKEALVKDVVDAVMAEGAEYGKTNIGNGGNVVVDFSSPNIAKPFHIGHIRSTVIGNSISKLYRALGYNVIGVNHLGDYGTQFGKMIVAYRHWGNREDVINEPIKTLLAYYTKFHVEAETHPELEDEARETFARLEAGEPEEKELWQWFRDESLKEFNRVYDMLGITFESYAGESFYSDKMPAVIAEMREKNLLVPSEGAEIVELQQYGLTDAPVLKSDGSSIYITRDIAAAKYRMDTYNFVKDIYVVASQQNLHFQQLKKIVELMGYDWCKDIIHVPFGLVSLEEGTMSTRHGRVVFLEDVLTRAVEQTKEIIREKGVNTENIDETAKIVGIGAVVFNELSNNRIKDYVFSWNKVLDFNGETGPYVQYTYARCASVLRNAGEEAVKAAQAGIKAQYITSESAFALAKLIYRLPQVVIEAAEKYEPSIVTRHLVDIAQGFNRFYHDEHILVDNEEEKAAKLALVLAAKTAIRNGLALLGMEAPERM
ncbi:MAG: arginine--tRNA ligase [Firmicutes bacterium]|nr:arginine--tRNA ligase [Bacillota bacterium]MBR6584983.1 arginine--tRNA ligase [Bacillota bacterium]